MLNHIVIMGRLTRDPELRYTQNQKAVTSFALAVDRDFSREDGSREVDFIEVVAWNSTAEFVSKYFTKGQMAVASGRLQLRDWTDKDGNKRRTAEVIASNVYFGGSKKDSGGQTDAPQGRGSTAAQQPGGWQPAGGPVDAGPGAFSELADADGELPF